MALTVCSATVAHAQYTVNQSGTFEIEYDSPTYIYPPADDLEEIPIGFDFQFFGNTYSSCFVGENGYVTFTNDASTCCSGQFIPDSNSPNNLIAAAWGDFDDSYYSIHYEVFGTAPFRHLAITFDLTESCNFAYYYGQIKLFETTNVIEIHTDEWAENATPCNEVTQGIENVDGSVAFTVSGRNANPFWTVGYGDEDFVSFTPDVTFSYSLSQSGTYSIEIDDPTFFFTDGDQVTQIPIGFNFSFYGQAYSDCYVGGDGFIVFGGDPGAYCCGQPIPTPGIPNNLIAVAWTNMDFSSTHYEVFGTAPYRRCVITFDLRNPCDEAYYGQVKLFETTNVIEIHTQEWQQDNCQGTWAATQGIENADGTDALPVPGRNYNGTWQVMPGDDDFVAFTPLGNGGNGNTAAYIFSNSGLWDPEYDFPNEISIPEDGYSDPLDIGFDFVFYGNTYDQVWMAQNGFLTFNSPGPGITSTPQTLPDPTDPNNLIAALWTNLSTVDCEFGCYSYETVGTAPNRRFLATFYPMNQCGTYIESQIKLFETSNIIEIHTYYDEIIIIGLTSGSGSGGFGCTNATQGLENSDGSAADVVPGRNNASWTAVEDYVKFEPVVSNDVGILANIDSYCEGAQDIQTIVTNTGSNVVDSMIINWSWNGVVQTPVSAIFPVDPGTNFLITLGSQTLTVGVMDTLVVWTSNPNGTNDPNPTNDTLSTYLQPALHGSYTIGGSSPDYPTFADAIADLTLKGVCDTVYMNVRPGAYNTHVLLGHIKGAFGKQVIFRPENGDSTSVVLNYTATGNAENYVLKFNNAHNITWEKMTLNALGSNYARVVDVSLFSFGITIRNCAINGKSVSTSSTNYACIFLNDRNSDITISHNTISNGSYGLYSTIPQTSYSNNIVFEGNTVLNVAYTSILVRGMSNAQIVNNTVSTNSSYSLAFGVSVVDMIDSLRFAGNTISMTQGYRGLSFSQVNPGIFADAKIYNNILNMPSAFSNGGIEISNCNNMDFFHNTALTGSNNTSAYTISITSCNTDSIFNNIFVNAGTSPVAVYGSNPNSTMDYNDYYYSGPNLGIYANSQKATLALWQAQTGLDAHSLNVDPVFSSSTDLHTNNNYLNAGGSPQFNAGFDIDFQARDTEHPDIGADEFVPSAADAAISTLLSPIPTCEAEQQVEITLYNLGTDTLSSVTIAWSVNNIPQSPVVLTPDLAPEGDSVHVVLGTYIFSNQPDTLAIWTTMPNGSEDGQTFNDTLNYIYRLPLNGTYTIGGTEPDFTSFAAAVTALEDFTFCGPVVFRFRDGIYTEQVAIDSIEGSSAINTITLESESADSSTVTIQFNAPSSAQNYVVQLNGVDYITIRNLGFKALNTSWADLLDIQNGVTHLTLENNHFVGSTSSGATSQLVNALAFGINEFFTIRNNYFLNGQQAFLFFGGGSTYSENPRDILIEHNTFVNQRLRAIDPTTVRGLQILDNTISTNVTNSGYIGIDLQNINEGVVIAGNKISIQNIGDGMFLNTMHNGLGIPGDAYIYNNMVNTASGAGIRLWNSVRAHVYYNNALTTGTNASNHHAFELVSGDTIDVLNNCFVANAGKAFHNNFVTPSVMTSDHNDLLTAGASLGQWNSITYSDLTTWQSGTGFDANSMSIDPQFVSSSDLHVLADTLDGAGITIPGISLDFDGESRNAIMPDIGADEIGANADDAGIIDILPKMPFARGNRDVAAVIRNYGSNEITSVDIHWSLDGVEQTPFAYAGNLATLDQDTVTLGVVNFILSTPYDLKAWTTQPNGNTDFYNTNDTLQHLDQYAAVSDTVTIGGVSPDVATIQAAFTALYLGGVLDSVHFQIRPGTYNEVVTLNQTSQLSCGLPVVIESETGDAEDVIWSNTGFTGHTLTLNGADGLSFRNLSISTVLSAFGHAVEVKNGSNCNNFTGCILTGLSTSSTSTANAVVYSGSTDDNSNTFTGNTFNGGSYGLCWIGSNESGTVVTGNTFHDQHYIGAYLNNQNGLLVNSNSWDVDGVSAGYYYGLHLNTVNGSPQIVNNQFHLQGVRGAGIYTASCSGSAGTYGLIANNYIQIGNSSNSYGINTVYGDYWKIYYNTVRVDGGNNTSAAFLRTSYNTTHTHLLNNILYNSAGGVAVASDYAGDVEISNHNALYVSGPTMVGFGGTAYTDLEAWQSTGHDLNSISDEPAWVVATSYPITNALYNGAAIPVAEVTSDIQGALRDGTMPDIGCDEFDLFSDDVGIVSINYPVQPFPEGVNTVFIKFVNNGQDTLTSMQVDWEADGIPQPTYYWSGLLPSAGTYDSLDIGTYDFTAYSAHSLKVWVSNPNGLPDGLASNDTLMSSGLYPALSGTYTVGGMSPDFDSLTQAVNTLILGGAFGAVTFDIRSGTYLEPLTITQFPGCGCGTPVIFESETQDSTSVTITNLGYDNTTVTLDGADGVIFQHLTLTSVNPAFRRVVDYYNGAHCNQFLNNEIIGFEGTSASSNHAVIWSNTSLDTANTFRNNLIQYGSYGLYLVGSTSAPSHTLIEQNTFEENYARAIYCNQEQGIQILANKITRNTGSTSGRGIELNNCHGDVRIIGNNIQSIGEYGLFINSCNATSTSHALIANNFSAIGGTGNAYGLYLNASQYFDVAHNNIHIFSTTGSSGNNTSLVLTNNSTLNLWNNVAFNSSPGTAIYANANTGFTSDFNDFFSLGSELGNWANTGQADLSAWQAASGGDNNSLSVNPQYMSDTDLHVSNILLNASATPLVSVTTDIDGDVREAMPDIGADEFIPAANDDAGVFMMTGPVVPFASGSQPVQIALKNFGGNQLTSATVRWIINGIEQAPYAWTGNLSPAQCDYVTLGNYPFDEYTSHNLILWTELPNGQSDTININDTLTIQELYPALNGAYTVGGVLPDFNLFSQLETALNKGGILGDVTFNVRNGMYSTQFQIRDFPRVAYGHMVTFQSESGDSSSVIIHRDFASAKNYTISLQDAHQVTLSHLTLKSSQGRVLEISDGASNVHVDRCRILGVQATFASNALQLIYSPTTTEDSISVINNRFELGSYGIFLSGSAGNREKHIVLSGNTFYNCYYRSIYAEHQDELNVNNNSIQNDNNAHEGIVLSSCINTGSISGNDIRLLNGGNWGLYMHAVSGTTLSPTLVANNYIYVKGGGVHTHGLYHSSGNYNNFYYNTVRIESTHPDSRAFTDVNSYNNIHLRNCSFSNTGGGRAMYVPWPSGFGTNTMDYCNLFSTGQVLLYWSIDYSDLATLILGTGQNLNSKSANPLFLTPGFHPLQVAMDNAGTPVAGVTTDIDNAPRSSSMPDIGCEEFVSVTNDIGISLLLTPESYCGLSNSEAVAVRVQNYGSNPQTGFDVAYSMNGAAWVTENVGSLVVNPGATLDYTFNTTANLGTPGTYTFILRTAMSGDVSIANDTLKNIVITHIPALVSPVSNMLPSNASLDLDKPLSLSWAPAPNATRYDVYIWQDGLPQPATPQVENLTQINTLYSQLSYGTTYHWKVIAKNVCDQMVPGPEQTFTIRKLPDLVVDTVIAPATAFSGQLIEVEWQVSNLGPGATLSQLWSDAVYLSTDATLNISFDTYLGAVGNLTALDSNGMYSNISQFAIPNGFTGTFYVFVYADRWNSLSETNNNNNWERTESSMMITLTPSPDLVVDDIVIPGSAFSGQDVPVTFKILNNGFGATNASQWRDLISLGTSGISVGDGIPLKNIVHASPLQPDSTYMVSTMAHIPENISGDRFIYITTDYLNQQYEFGAENNNTGISDTLQVFLTPPPDLVPVSIDIADTVSSNAHVPLTWTVQNAGATGPVASYWHDKIELSPSPIYNTNFNSTLATASHAPPLLPGESYLKSKTAHIPVSAHGVYYLYAYTDYNNRVFEYEYESNNIFKRPTPVFVASPDLKLDTLIAPTMAMSGTYVGLSYRMINIGIGDLVNRTYKDKILLSLDEVADGSDIVLGAVPRSGITLASGDTSTLNAFVALPPGISGTYYLLVQADSDDQVFENNSESNNIISTGTPLVITLTPTPDLVPENIAIADTVYAGETTQLSFAVRNQGGGTATSSWVDGIYYSFSPTWNPAFATKILGLTNPGNLKSDSVNTKTLTLLLPNSITSNVYYFYIWADETNTVYENGLDANNIQRSDPVFIHGLPPVDLVADTVFAATDTLYSGIAFFPTYDIRNGGSGPLLVNTWIDRGYLSVDSIFDPELDLLCSSATTQTSGISAGGVLSRNTGFAVPNGVSGDYYFFIDVDADDLNADINRSNNHELIRTSGGAAKKLFVKLSPYPDLRLKSFVTTSSAIAGQPLLLQWETENAGTGTAAQWVEKIYLSSDETINAGDHLLYSRTGMHLKADSLLTGTASVFLPASANGNYVLILQTDANNQLFEFNGEDNNILLRSIAISQAPPSDLVVSNVTVPPQVIAGKNATISWNTTNQGAFVANGQLREIVYLSADPVLDVDDVIFGIQDGPVFLSPEGSQMSNHSGPVLGVAVGQYYALVQTDARNNITESDELNNITPSLDLMQVDVKELYLDSLTLDTLSNNAQLYYKIVVPATYEGYNLFVSVAGDTLAGSVELYGRFGQVPTRAEHDIAFDRPFDSYQQFVFRDIQPGTYYIMAYGVHDTEAQQTVTLYARLLSYALLSNSPVRGGNDGFVTMTLKGSDLDSTAEVRLTDTLFNYYPADTFIVLDDATIIARFDLRNVPPGVYTIQSTKPDDFLGQLADAFTVIEGGGADLQVVYSYSPGSFFANTAVTRLIVEAINNGDNDIENAAFQIESVFGSQLSYDLQEYLNNISTDILTIPIGSTENGFENILAPGQAVRFEFPMRTSPYPLASIIVVENE